MTHFSCSQQSCGFSCLTKHGLDIHLLRAHKVTQTLPFKTAGPACKKSRSGRLPVPKSLNGQGSRLTVDRITASIHETFYDDSAEEERDRVYSALGADDLRAEMSKKRELSNGTSDKSNDVLCDAIIHISNMLGDRHVNELLDKLRFDVNKSIKFLYTFASVESIRERRRKDMEEKISRQGFREEECVVNGIKFMLYHRDPLKCSNNKLGSHHQAE